MRLPRFPVLALAATCALGCSFDQASAEKAEAAEGAAAPAAPTAPVAPPKQAILVRARPLARGPIERRLEASANVESLDVVDVVSERAEPVARVLVEEGQAVRAGQPLAELRADQVLLALKEAEVQVLESRTQMAQAERDYQRNLRLWEEGGGTPRLIAEQVVESSLQTWEVTQTAHQASQVLLDRAKWEETRCVLRSPIDGTVTQRDISVGDMAVIGQRAFQVADLSRPKVIFYRPQRELALLREGQALTAGSEALPGARIRGRIERVSPVVDAATGTVKVTAALEPEGRVLPVGVLMRLEILLERREDVLLVPKEGLLYEGDAYVVFVARDGAAKRIVLQAGFEDPAHVEALPESGLAEGDLLIVVGADRLADGDPVEVAAE